MLKHKIQHYVYKNILRPFLFTIDSEKIHNIMTNFGEASENLSWLIEASYKYKNPKLKKNVLGVSFENPIGLAAGFDYNGHLAKAMKHIGFGFNTVGTVTARPYEGNKPPRLGRLVKSQSILVNKGFKSDGAIKIAERLGSKNLKGHTIGISVSSSNLPEINSISKAIDDYLFTFNIFSKKQYVSYFELNISCPNAAMSESFSTSKNFLQLTDAVYKLHLNKPIFIKMPNEISLSACDTLVSIGLKNSIHGYIFSNLVKNRQNKFFIRSEIAEVKNLKGNFSGKPTFENSNKLIKHAREKFGKNIAIIGCGGVFNTQDALTKFACGADLVQLITGMIFEGPQIAGEINSELNTYLYL